jgi:dTDP-glucose 4,6-dehydratase
MTALARVSDRPLRSLLVTGGAGFIGSAFLRMLFRAGPGDAGFSGRVVNLDALTYAGNRENVDPFVPSSWRDSGRYTFVRGQVQNQELVQHLIDVHDIDTVVHFAAESHVDRSIVGPRAFVETNVLGTFALLEAARARHAQKKPMHVHHISTDEVFGSLGDTGFFTETTSYDPRSPYSASKAASDHFVSAYAHTYGLSVTMSNCSNNYGPFHFPEKLIPLMILNCLEGKPLPVYGQGQNVRDWIFVDDHVEGVWQVLQRGASGQSFNLGGKNEWKNLDLVHKLVEVVAAEAKRDPAALRALITFVADRPGHDHRYAIDCSKAERDLGWVPKHNFESGLKETVRWYLNNDAWVQNVKSGAYRTWLDTNYAKRGA